MSDITFGTALQTVTDVAGFARRAEELGFDLLGCGEHVMFHGPVGNTFISLSVAAGATQRIRLLSSIVLLPLYPAALAAKLGAALDVASNGRYNFGVGVGGEFPKEFEACGVPVKQRGARTNEALEVITRSVDGAGRHLSRPLHHHQRGDDFPGAGAKAAPAHLGGRASRRRHEARRALRQRLAAVHVHAGTTARQH